ncbi:MAG: thioredoxin family protein, partial [Planctomycetota bacterium]
MRRIGVLFGMLLLVGSSFVLASDVVLEGVKPARWTMDLEAAQKEAKARKVPLLLNFSGSDWCGWCKIMEENV